MNQPAAEINAAEAAETAFNRSAAYVWEGHPVTWANEHDWLANAIFRRWNFIGEQMALIMMWIGTREDIRTTSRQWYADPDPVFDELADFMNQFAVDSPEMTSALDLGAKIKADLQASTDDVDTSETSDGTGAPKKPQAAPDTPQQSTPQPD